MYTRVKTDTEIRSIKESGRLLATVMGILKKEASVGMSTKELADVATRELKALGARPAFLGYQGFPDSLCVSVNDEIVHGIPRRDKILSDGDILSMDFGVEYEQMITDSAVSLILGKASKADDKLLSATLQSLNAGIEQLKDGVRVGDIAAAVQGVLDSHNYGIVRDLVGHGVGHRVHEEPNIPNYGMAGTGPALHAGMTIAIEPMATRGTHKITVDDDGWTIRTADGSRSAHFEHTVLITHDGFEILTAL
jgi:methionyl aminopeptidase